MKLSVIIPTRHRNDMLTACLTRLSEQLEANDEIIVVDNAANDSTRKLIRSFRASCPVLYVAETRPGASRARNSGFHAANNDGIAFIDDDSLVTAEWAASVRSLLGKQLRKKADVVFQGDMIQRYAHNRTYERIRRREFAGDMEELGMYAPVSGITPVASLIVANIFGLRRAFLRVKGPFDAERFPFIGEDFDLSMRLLKHGVRLMRAPGAAVVHAKPAMTLRGACRAAYLYGRAQAIHEKLYAGDPDLIVQSHLAATTVKNLRKGFVRRSSSGRGSPLFPRLWYRLWTRIYYEAGYVRFNLFYRP